MRPPRDSALLDSRFLPKYLRGGDVPPSTVCKWAIMEAKGLKGWTRRAWFHHLLNRIQPELRRMLKSAEPKTWLRAVHMLIRLESERVRFERADLRYVGELVNATLVNQDPEAERLLVERLRVGDGVSESIVVLVTVGAAIGHGICDLGARRMNSGSRISYA